MAKKGSDWYFGIDHDELLLQTVQRKSAARKGGSSERTVTSSLEAQSVIKIGDLVKLVSELLECNFDSLFDSFRQIDQDELGRIPKHEFREGIRNLSKSLNKINDALIDELFACIDLDKDGTITLEEYIGFFSKNCRCTRAVVKSGHSVMPVATGLKMETARGDLLASDSHYHGRSRFNELASPQRAMRPGSSKVAHVALRARTRHSKEFEGGRTNPTLAPDFERKHKWIDNMMKDLAVPWQNEPARMDGKWDKFLSECRSLDIVGKKTISVEGFRNALTRTEPKLSADQIEWFVKDAEKTEAGDITYEVYASKRKDNFQLTSKPDDFKMLYTEAQIRARLRINYPSVKAAFKSMDVDRDGRMSKGEFLGMLRKLQINSTSRAIDAVFRHLDVNHDGYIEYEDYIKAFATHAPNSKAIQISDDAISTRLMEQHANIADLFRSIDKNDDGIVTSEEFFEALVKSRMLDDLPRERVAEYAASLDVDGNGVIDLRDFLRHFSKFDTKSLSCLPGDPSVRRWMDRIRAGLREKFDDAKQAFHAFDRTFSCRLSFDDFSAGLRKFVLNESETGSAETAPALIKVFEFADGNGDGFLDYHDFITRFEIKAKQFITGAIESDLREILRARFPSSITDAFKALDIDSDGRISRNDFRVGLSKLGKDLTDSELDALIRRFDLDSDHFVDYDEFLLRFGLETQKTGKWVYKIDEPPPPSIVEMEQARIFKDRMHGSKWWGRGGIVETLRKFDGNKDGKLGQGEFKAALVDDRTGLGMSGLTDDDIAAFLGGSKMEKPYCVPASKSLDIQKFGLFFVDAHFEREKHFFNLLLVQNKWLDIMEACEAVSSDGGDRLLVSKADLAACLKRLVDASVIRAEDRKVVLDTCVQEKLFIKEGIHAGFLDYKKELFDRFIGKERQIYELISPVWQDLHLEMSRIGNELNYFQFEDLCKPFLSSDQVTWLIDVMDTNNDGLISCNEFLRRYARDEHDLAIAMQTCWKPVHDLLQKARLKLRSGHDTVPPSILEATLVRAIQDEILVGVDAQKVPALVKNACRHSGAPNGDIMCTAWVCKYARLQFKINEALEGRHASGLPLWDEIIRQLEACALCRLDECDAGAPGAHRISREQFRQILSRAGVRFGAAEEHGAMMHRFLMDLDPQLTGTLDWVALVDGEGASAPYFFSARSVRGVRQAVREHWEEILRACVRAERACGGRRGERAAPRDEGALRSFRLLLYGEDASGLVGVLPAPDFAACVHGLSPPPSSDASRTSGGEPPIPAAVKAEVCALAGAAFPGGSRDEVDYLALLEHYAREELRAEVEMLTENELLLRGLASLRADQCDGEDQYRLASAQLAGRLLRPELGLSDALVAHVVRRESRLSPVAVDVRDASWRCACRSIRAILDQRWLALYRCWRAADAQATGRIPLPAVRAGLDRCDVGLSALQAQCLEWQVARDSDGLVDYRAVLRGQAVRGAREHRNEAFETWLALESGAGWDCVAQCVKDAAGGGRMGVAGVAYSEARGYAVPTGALRTYLLQARRLSPERLAGLTAAGLDRCLEVFESAGEWQDGARGGEGSGFGSALDGAARQDRGAAAAGATVGSGASHSGTIMLDEATWMLFADKLRSEILTQHGGHLAQRIMKTFREEAARNWDKIAASRGLDGYSATSRVCPVASTDWGLKVAAVERCLAESLGGVAWINSLHTGALARRASRCERWCGLSHEGNDRTATSITEAGMACALRSLEATAPFGALHQIPFRLHGASEHGPASPADSAETAALHANATASLRSTTVMPDSAAPPASPLEAAEGMAVWLTGASDPGAPSDAGSGAQELEGLVEEILAASRLRDEWWLPDAVLSGAMDGQQAQAAARKARPALAGFCVLRDGRRASPAAISRPHMRGLLQGRAPALQHGSDAGRLADGSASVSGGFDSAQLRGIAEQRAEAVYASPAWTLLWSCAAGERGAAIPDQDRRGLPDVPSDSQYLRATGGSSSGAPTKGLPAASHAPLLHPSSRPAAAGAQSRVVGRTEWGGGGGLASEDLRRLAEERRRSGVYGRIDELRARREQRASAAPGAPGASGRAQRDAPAQPSGAGEGPFAGWAQPNPLWLPAGGGWAEVGSGGHPMGGGAWPGAAVRAGAIDGGVWPGRGDYGWNKMQWPLPTGASTRQGEQAAVGVRGRDGDPRVEAGAGARDGAVAENRQGGLSGAPAAGRAESLVPLYQDTLLQLQQLLHGS